MYYVNIHSVLDKNITLLCMSAILFTCLSFPGFAQEATIHGAVYEWDSFDPLEDVIVEVNSTPSQSMLANYGIYSFNLDPGNYLVSASYYRNNELAAYTEEEVTIMDDGDYVLDLILFPAYYDDPLLNESDFSELDDIANFSESDDEGSSLTLSESLVTIVAILLILLLAGVVIFIKQKKEFSTSDDFSSDHLPDAFMLNDTLDGLPDDLREVISIIAKNGGRITQKDLRTRVKHSEAKVSLMVSDLESRGIVRKFKKGRGNIIILDDPESAVNIDSEEEVTDSSNSDQ